MPKMSKSHLRKLAYGYIVDRLSNSSVSIDDSHQYSNVSLHELMLLKEGLADPSVQLVALLKQLLRGSVTEVEIDAHLVAPFKKK